GARRRPAARATWGANASVCRRAACARFFFLLVLADPRAWAVSARRYAVPRAGLVARNELAGSRKVRQGLRAHRSGGRQSAQLAGPDVLDRRGGRGEQDLYFAAEQGREGRPVATIGDVNQVGAGRHVEQFAG